MPVAEAIAGGVLRIGGQNRDAVCGESKITEREGVVDVEEAVGCSTCQFGEGCGII